jgi:two-component system, NarL family, nitrate/nitrite response regulator NarL
MRKSRSRTSGPQTPKHPPTTVGVVVYARHYREAVLRTLEDAAGLAAVDLGEGNAASLEKVNQGCPEVLLVDLSNQRLAVFVRQAHAAVPSTPIIALNRGETEPELLSLFECGLTGFVAHDASSEEMLETIRSVRRGEFACPPRIVAALVRLVNAAGETEKPACVAPALSPRELQIVGHLEQSLSNKEIANRLGIEAATVKNHVHNLLRKLATHRRGDAAAQLRSRGPKLRIIRRSPTRRDH